jgi:hypothetical protein
MSTAAVSQSSLYQELQTYFQTRQGDLQQLGQDLQSGDLTDAQQEFSAIQTLAQSGPFANGDAFYVNQRQQDFNAIGQALQSGNLTAAQQAFSELQSTFKNSGRLDPEAPASGTGGSTPTSGSTTATPVSQSTSTPTSGPAQEIVLNLGNVTPGEEITIGIGNNASGGGEQLTVSVANQQNQAPEQITLNLDRNSNEEIILNLFNSASQSATQSSGVNVSA